MKIAQTNAMWRLGLPYTDDDYVKEFGLNPDKSIDEQMLDMVEEEQYRSHIQDGNSEKKARQLATTQRNTTVKNHKRQFNAKKEAIRLNKVR